jgi:hypothetical protein
MGTKQNELAPGDRNQEIFCGTTGNFAVYSNAG